METLLILLASVAMLAGPTLLVPANLGEDGDFPEKEAQW